MHANESNPRGDYLVVVSEADPVAVRVADHWGTPAATGEHVDGAVVRRLSPRALLLRRAQFHIHDEGLDARLPAPIRQLRPTLVFPSIHRSESNVRCLTVHPIGNPGPTAEVGGRPGRLVPTDPELMVDALRALDRARDRVGLRATYEATHHGPELDLPAFFVEIGFGSDSGPPEEAVRLLAEVIPYLLRSGKEHVAVAVGGGHYAPHFSDLAVHRRWAFGHILSRHSLTELEPSTARAARAQTPDAEGILAARAEDAALPVVREIGDRLREGAAPRHETATRASGT